MSVETNLIAAKHLPRWLNKIVKFIQCHEVPGKYRLYEATKHSYNNVLITYHIKNANFSIPWDQWCFWKNYGPENYYLDEIEPFTQVLNQELGQFDFFDLGADVGVVSALVNKYCADVQHIYAFEPNPTSFQVLKDNIANIAPCHNAYNQAVSDFSGQCSFNFNNAQGSDHEGHIVKGEVGATEVISLDLLVEQESLNIHENIALKIDVEGQELAVFSGAKQLITDAKKIVVLLELHPDVLTRDKQTPEDLFAAAERIRGFRWYVPIDGNKEVIRGTEFFSQFPLQQYDVIGISL